MSSRDVFVVGLFHLYRMRPWDLQCIFTGQLVRVVLCGDVFDLVCIDRAEFMHQL